MSIPRIGLAMIVKDEESNIRRALESARPYISTWVIVDTGSTDRTMDIIRETYKDIPGVLVERPWINFGHNRTELLEICCDEMEWALMLDADDTVEGYIPDASIFHIPEADGLKVQIIHGDFKHRRIHLFRMSSDWIYNGVLHEIPVLRDRRPPNIADIPDTFIMRTRCEGVRSKDPLKYYNDALLLTKEYEKDPTNTRTLFYLANSWRDAGNMEEALKYYRLYIDHPKGWDQEKFTSLTMLINYSNNKEERIRNSWKAIQFVSHRIESIHAVLEFNRMNNHPVDKEIYSHAFAVKNRKILTLDIFANAAVYDWALDFEISVITFRYKDYTNAILHAARSSVKAPAYVQEVIKQIIQESTEALIESGQ